MVTSSPPRRRMRAHVRREHVLDAALELFATRGYRVSLDDIAKSVGVTRTVVYYYFSSKKELFLEVQQRELTDFLRHVAPAMSSTGSYEDRARMLFNATLGFAESNPHGWDLLLGGPRERDPDVREAATTIRSVFKASTAGLLAADVERFGLDPTGPAADLTFDVLIAGVVAAVSWWRENPTQDRDTMVDWLARFGGAAARGIESLDA